MAMIGKLTYTLGEMSYRSDMSAPSILNVIELAKFLSRRRRCFRHRQEQGYAYGL